MAVHFEMRGRIALLVLDNFPVNAVSKSVREGLEQAIAQAVACKASRIVITGSGKVFAAGADAREFDAPPAAPHLNDILSRLSSLSIPSVAAINGTALGGGLEIALACRYRIASPAARLGLPEVTLGVIPGAGGTQRLPRLIGLLAATDLIGQGKSVPTAEALALGMIDQLSDDPVSAALALDQDLLSAAVPADVRTVSRVDNEALARLQQEIGRRSKGQVAPSLAIALVEHSTTLPLADAMASEREAFLKLRGSDQSRALRHVFFAERSAQGQGKAFASPATDIASAIVVGGGNMGSAIAYAFASAGIAVTVIEQDAAAVERARQNLHRLADQGVQRRQIDAAQADAIRSRLALVEGYDSLPECDLIIEAAFEDLAVKRAIFATLESRVSRRTILATNTSYLDVNELAAALAHPDRFVGLHFFSPAHIMKLLEIVEGQKTSEATLAAALGLARKLKKIPVLAGVCDGFIGNRILTRYRHAADILLVEGATPAAIDAAMTEFGMAMGPYAAQDMSGLDIAYANRKRQDLKSRARYRYVPLVERLVETGRLGRKTSAGWYDYDAHGKALPASAVEDRVRQTSSDAGVTRRTISGIEIVQRLTLAMIAEAADSRRAKSRRSE